MIAEQKTSQLRIKPNAIIAEGCGGTIFYATPTRARMLIDAGAAVLVNMVPAEAPVIGPSETKPMEPAEKKYSAADRDGRLTASAQSAESGKAALSSSSAAALVSPQRNALSLPKRGRPQKQK